jgi:hypothetical protein
MKVRVVETEKEDTERFDSVASQLSVLKRDIKDLQEARGVDANIIAGLKQDVYLLKLAGG